MDENAPMPSKRLKVHTFLIRAPCSHPRAGAKEWWVMVWQVGAGRCAGKIYDHFLLENEHHPARGKARWCQGKEDIRLNKINKLPRKFQRSRASPLHHAVFHYWGRPLTHYSIIIQYVEVNCNPNARPARNSMLPDGSAFYAFSLRRG